MSKPCTVTIENVGRSFLYEDGYVLDSAIANAIPVPYNCRGGACGTCKAEVVEGAVEHGWVMGFAITDEEIAAGRCLICACRPTTERLVLRMLGSAPAQEPAAVFVPKEYAAEVVSVQRLTSSVISLTLQMPAQERFRFNSGMYMDVLTDGLDAARPYSIVTSPDAEGYAPDGMINFLIARHERGRASTWLHDAVCVGDTLRVRGPYGTFQLPHAPRGKILMLAGGTGLAPLLSMASGLLDSGSREPVELLFSVRTRSEVFCLAELRRLAARHANFTFQVFITRGDESNLPQHCQRRRITEHLAEAAAQSCYELVLIAGSHGFTEACAQSVRNLGVSADAILTEAYESRAGNRIDLSRKP